MSEITWANDRRKQLAQLLTEEREARKLRQWDLARRLYQHQSLIARIESGQRRIDVCEFLHLAEAIGFDPIAALNKIRGANCNGGGCSLDEALTVVQEAGYRTVKSRRPVKLKSPKHKNQVGPTCVAEFADGTRTRMTTCTSLEKLDWDRGVRLSRAAYQSRHPGAPVLPTIISVHFEQDGKVLAQRKGETNVVVRN
jgi:transcriptional regulator with XRE-family HTH domain